ncbi:MAG TPA: hypothetical protein PKL49_02550 [Steroidobacteraceae bacterium]|nr:hypothetical protein [Steroidobacteraceae bacterium]HNS26595.1 hypothetical protein [Steroidobacteraceae bacterium]
MDTVDFITVPSRFRGPDHSANGGYFAGLVSARSASPVTVRLLSPPPLDEPMLIQREGATLRVTHAETIVAEARAIDGGLPAAPEPPSYEEALEASRHYAGFHTHIYPNCFVCGMHRERGDGLRIFPGDARDGLVAAPWVPDASLAGDDGKVAPEFMSAALDCPGYFAVHLELPLLLGEFTVHIDRRVHIDEPCVVVGWRLGSSGRKHVVGTALYDEDGQLCARARGLWIEPRV